MRQLRNILLLILLSITFILAEGGNKKSKLEKPAGPPTRALFNINNISTWLYNNGDSDLNPKGDSGFEFPKGSEKYAFFESGLVWGAKIDGKIHVGGSTYNQGIQGGAIKENGTQEDPDAEHVRIYRVCTNFSDYDFSDEETKLGLSEVEVRAQYEKDWDEWPAEYGAPFVDVDKNGNYDPLIDIPGVDGADQTLWFVANDLDTTVSKGLYGSDPMKVEVQVTAWGYKSEGALGNTLFKKYKLINKSDKPFEDMYFSYWSDPDVGDAGDDFVGVDLVLSLAYTYNSSSLDSYYGTKIPSVGYDFVQGPIVPSSETDVAIYNHKKVNGYKNLEASSYTFWIGSDPVFSDPDLRDYNGALQFYNTMQGKISITGLDFIDPVTNKVTKFCLAGDPVTKSGWIDGILHSPGDRRHVLTTGPFNMAAGDTQEVVLAQLGAFGLDYINSITKLKEADIQIQEAYDNLLDFYFPPISPVVQASIEESNYEFKLEWENAEEVESFDKDGYEFQGYKIYQFSNSNKDKNSYRLLKTFDKIDGIKTISEFRYDPVLGIKTLQDVVFGTDSGLQYQFTINKDYLNDSKLIKGKTYYFGVTSFTYNSDQSKETRTTESLIGMVEIVFREHEGGIMFSDDFLAQHTEGNSDTKVSVRITDPDLITGDDYEVTFHENHYYLDSDGEWKPTNFPDSVGKYFGKDVSPSSLQPYAGYSATGSPTSIDIKLTLNLESPTDAWVDGIKIKLPQNIVVNTIEFAHSNYSHDAINYIYDESDNTIFWGRNDTTLGGNHSFSGGEVLEFNVNSFTPPLEIEYEIFDDGYGSEDDNGNLNPINALGSSTIEKISHHFETRNEWNLRNITSDTLVLKNQTRFNNSNSWWYRGIYNYGPEAEGFQVIIEGSFDSPIDFQYYEVYKADNPENGIRYYASTSSIASYLTPYGWAASSRSIDAFGAGTTDVAILQKDYEFRFTGEYEENPDARGIRHVKYGTGSIATIYNVRGMNGLEEHPMNPNPGSDEAFTVRIPFEVWNINDNRQVNLVFVDRKQAADANPFYAWNPDDRMHCEILNTPYSEKVQKIWDKDKNPTELAKNLTWNLVFWKTEWETGDVVKINYANPIIIGVDKFTFSTSEFYDSVEVPLVSDLSVSQNYPNPFNPSTTIDFTIPVEVGKLNSKNVKIDIYDILGRKVKTLINEKLAAGKHKVTFNAVNLASGVYFYRIEAGKFIQTKKMMLLK